MLPGDMLLLACFVSYIGGFTPTYRHDLMENIWKPAFRELKVPTQQNITHFCLIDLTEEEAKYCPLIFHSSPQKKKPQNIQPAIPHTDTVDPLHLICDDALIAVWHNEGLPNDRMSTENAVILTNATRWPLIVDPQL